MPLLIDIRKLRIINTLMKRGTENVTRSLASLADVDADVDINVRDDRGYIPLHIAALVGHTDVVRTLVEAGADLNVKTEDNKTPLQLAEEYNNEDVAELLREHGGEK